MDLDALETAIGRERPGKIPLVMITVTNNSGGGQPVCMANIRAAQRDLPRARRPVLHRRLPLRRERLVHQAARAGLRGQDAARRSPGRCSAYADGCTMSAKKDGMVNIGGFLAMNDDDLAARCKTC